jgi:hypothetical protein
MNQNPTYKIYGEERRKLKKELSLLKSLVNGYWRFQDCCEMYGEEVIDKDETERMLNEKKAIIAKLEKDLSVKWGIEHKLERILKEN